MAPSEAAPAPVRAPAGRVGKSTVLGVGSLPQPGAGSAPSTRPPGAPSSPPQPTSDHGDVPEGDPRGGGQRSRSKNRP